MDFGESLYPSPLVHPLIQQQPDLPQIEYSDLLTILPYIREGFKNDGSDPFAPHMVLWEAHLLAIFWGKLYLSNIFTVQNFVNGCELLWDNWDFARCDILDLAVTTVLSEFPDEYADEVDLTPLICLQEEAREKKMEYLERID